MSAAMARQRVLRQTQLWSSGRILLRSFVTGLILVLCCLPLLLLVFVAYLAPGPMPKAPMPILILVLAVMLLWPCVALWRNQDVIRTAIRAAVFALGSATGVMTPFGCLALTNLGRPDAMGPLHVAVMWCGVAIFYVPLSVVFILLANRMRQPAILQDGSRCPSCAYCLVGNISMVCPECGTPYTLGDLDTTEAEVHDSSTHDDD